MDMETIRRMMLHMADYLERKDESPIAANDVRQTLGHIEAQDAEIEKLWAELVASGRRAVLSQAEIERLRSEVGKIADECKCQDYIQRTKLWKIAHTGCEVTNEQPK